MERVALALAASILIAGCVTYVTELADDTYALSADIPTVVVGDTATFQLDIAGDLEMGSDHIGGHFWPTSQADPTATIGESSGCAHDVADDVVGSYTVSCTFPAPGTYYLRGHMRITHEDEPFNFWTEETVIEVVELSLATSGGDTAAIGETYNFTLDVTGAGQTSSTHIGAHYWDAAQEDPTASFNQQLGGCAHTEGALPGTFAVTCTWDEAGTYHVYGHVRLNDGSQDINLWSPGFTVTVS